MVNVEKILTAGKDRHFKSFFSHTDRMANGGRFGGKRPPSYQKKLNMENTTSKLKPWFRTPQEDFDDKKIVFERGQKHWDEIFRVFPDINGECQISMDDLGQSLIRCFVYCPKDISDKDTRIITRWMKNYFGNAERNFREKEGRFFWKSNRNESDEYGTYEFMFFIENTHPLTCEIKKVTKEVEVFESICK